jgi:hypothetical protein
MARLCLPSHARMWAEQGFAYACVCCPALYCTARSARRAHKEQGFQAAADGDGAASHACFQRAIEVTFDMKARLMRALRLKGVRYIGTMFSCAELWSVIRLYPLQ